MKLTHLALAAFIFPACANDRDAVTIGGDACGHFADGPIIEATVAATAADAVSVSSEHTRWDLTLGAMGTVRGGFVKVDIARAGERTFFFDKAADVTMTGAGGAVVQPVGVVTSDAECATIAGEFRYSLGVGTYTLALSTTADKLLLVWFGSAVEHPGD